jgi:periplasmic divalent cation tolerance protein
MLLPTRGRFVAVLVTAPDKKVARKLARVAVETRLAACANLIGGIESCFWWEGKIDMANETLILFKTTTALLRKLERLIVAQHPYETPEFIVVPLAAGNSRYLKWLRESLQQ